MELLFGIIILPANFVCGGYTVFTLSVRASVCPSVRPSVTFCFLNILKSHCWIFIKPCNKVGRSKPPPVLTSGFNRLKPSRSICQKVVNTGQYESEWSIENSKWRFCGGLRYLYRFMFYPLNKEKKYCFVPAKGTFHGEISISRP